MQSLTQSAFVLPTQPSPILSESSISWNIVNRRKMSTYIAVEGVHKDVVGSVPLIILELQPERW